MFALLLRHVELQNCKCERAEYLSSPRDTSRYVIVVEYLRCASASSIDMNSLLKWNTGIYASYVQWTYRILLWTLPGTSIVCRHFDRSLPNRRHWNPRLTASAISPGLSRERRPSGSPYGKRSVSQSVGRSVIRSFVRLFVWSLATFVNVYTGPCRRTAEITSLWKHYRSSPLWAFERAPVDLLCCNTAPNMI